MSSENLQNCSTAERVSSPIQKLLFIRRHLPAKRSISVRVPPKLVDDILVSDLELQLALAKLHSSVPVRRNDSLAIDQLLVVITRTIFHVLLKAGGITNIVRHALDQLDRFLMHRAILGVHERHIEPQPVPDAISRERVPMHASRYSSLSDVLRDGVEHSEHDFRFVPPVDVSRHLVQKYDELDPF